MPIPDRAVYTQGLFERLNQGVVVGLREASVPLEEDTWHPAAGDCHGNATTLAATFPNQLAAVHGWLVFDFRQHWGRVEFMHHSVVRELDTGVMFDPTPQDRHHDYSFIAANIADEDYVELVASLEPGEKLIWQMQ